jgi:hypothetical protein
MPKINFICKRVHTGIDEYQCDIQNFNIISDTKIRFQFNYDGRKYDVSFLSQDRVNFDISWYATNANGDIEQDSGKCALTDHDGNNMTFKGYWYEEYDLGVERYRYDFELQYP